MNTQGKGRWNGGPWRRRQALIRALAALSGVALALGVSAGAMAQTTALPEGWHDGNEDVVTEAWMCTAFGWAVDPDNRDRDVTVRVLADGNEVASTSASDYGQDMDELGICPGGTCRFTINLWNLISLGEEHLIRVQALDEGTAIWVDLQGTPRALECEAPPARLVVSITGDWIRAENFSPEALLMYRIYPSPESAPAEFSDPADTSGMGFLGSWEHGLDLVPGNLVVVSDGINEKALLLEPVSLDVFDPENDYLEGTAPAGRAVWVGVGNETVGCGMDVVTGVETGLWTADFSTVGCDVTEDMWAAAQISDADGDATETNPAPAPPIPWFTVFPESEYIEGRDWPEGEVVHLTIDDPATPEISPDYEQHATAGHPEWDPVGIWVTFSFGDEYDVKAGDLVTLTHGMTSVAYEVEPISLTDLDPGADTITGTAVPGETVYVWQHGEDWAIQEPAAGLDGTWVADFKVAAFDLLPGASGRAEVRDQIGNSTAVDWHIASPPIPWFTVFPVWEYIEGRDWPEGEVVHLTIDDPATPGISPDYEQYATAGHPEWDPIGIWVTFSFGDEYDVKAGDMVSLTSITAMRSHTVRNLMVTAVNADTDTVAGTADRDETVYVWPHGEDWAMQTPTAGEDGAWLADFSIAGFDLVGGMSGRAQIPDEAGNATAVDWTAPNPHLIAFPENEAVEGWEWPDGATVYLTIDNAPGFRREGTAAVTTWGDPRTYVRFDFADAYYLKPGDVVTLTDGVTARTHAVLNLSITVVDAEADTIAGTADGGAVVQVWPHGFDQTATVQATAGGDGTWVAEFSGLFTLVGWTGGRAQIVDETGNATAVDWQVPLPVQIDIQPWTSRNTVACGFPAAWLPVAVLSAEGFDATQLYTDSIRFGRTGTEADVIRIGREERPVQYATDVNRDGLPDMVYVFRFGDTGFSCADIPAGRRTATLEATLTGWMDGGMVEGSDSLTLFRLSGH